ncbi:MAG: hypothetical protein ACREEM_36685 [Blastocatellia bacterium]
MKFRVQCSSCGATFFSPDRKARICPKCARKRQGSAPAGDARSPQDPRTRTDRPAPPTRPGPAAPKPPKEPKPPRPPKATEVTPEQIAQIEQIYRERFANSQEPGGPTWLDMVKTISDEVWINRKVVSSRLRKIVYPDVPLTPELKSRIIEKYRHYVEHGERPPAGRRKTIGQELGVPFTQVRSIVYEWSLAQFKQSPTPELTREQRFEIEKLYWAELEARQRRLEDIPGFLADRLGNVNSYQVSRWFDQLHDDDTRFAGVPDVTPEVEEKILEAYRQYLASPAPPEKGLHATIAGITGGITTRQVHKTLQRYRNRRRAEYPLR